MKNLVSKSVIVAFIVIILFNSCKKSNTTPATPGIVGNWHLVSDAGYVDGGNIPPEPHTYKGIASDHYNFQAGGNLSWHDDNSGSDTSTYRLKSADTVIIAYEPKSNPRLTETYGIKALTAHEMELILVGGGVVVDTLRLSR